jgi:hypothetical protein
VVTRKAKQINIFAAAVPRFNAIPVPDRSTGGVQEMVDNVEGISNSIGNHSSEGLDQVAEISELISDVQKETGELKIEIQSLKTQMKEVESELAGIRAEKQHVDAFLALREILTRVTTQMYLRVFELANKYKAYTFTDLKTAIEKLRETGDKQYHMRNARFCQIVDTLGFTDCDEKKIMAMKKDYDLNGNAQPTLTDDDVNSCIEYMEPILDVDEMEFTKRLIDITKMVKTMRL